MIVAKKAFGDSVTVDNLDDIDMYECDIEELAEQFVEEGLFGEIPAAIRNYIDMSAIARDIGYDYTEVENNGSSYCLRW